MKKFTVSVTPSTMISFIGYCGGRVDKISQILFDLQFSKNPKFIHPPGYKYYFNIIIYAIRLEYIL